MFENTSLRRQKAVNEIYSQYNLLTLTQMRLLIDR